jgi:putative toxin-antitoxin system antitoxin component (TIGR02293 family)
MAHAVAHSPSSNPLPTAGGRNAAPRRGLHVLRGVDPHTSKAAALAVFRKFAERSPLPLGVLRAQLIPDATWKRAEDVLGPSASQTFARLVHALEFATRTWQNEADAIDWLLGPHMELGGATPYSLLRTESGGRAVEYVMAALEYGFPV